MAQTIAELEARWRAAAKTQAEAKQTFDATFRQMKASGIDIDSEPAVLIVRRNLEKSIADYESAITTLVTEAAALRAANSESSGSERSPRALIGTTASSDSVDSSGLLLGNDSRHLDVKPLGALSERLLASLQHVADRLADERVFQAARQI
jgi:hypothetical protein